jgi:membrane fusion protein, multidrug efflux system
MAVLLLASILPACAKKADSTARSGGGRRGDQAVPVLAAQATREDVPVLLKTIGTVEAYRTVSVRARVVGELTRVHFREGEDVREGDLLFTIDPRPYDAALKAAEADLAQERAKAVSIESDAKRIESLAQGDYASQQERDHVMSAAAAQRALVLSMEANLDEARLNLEFCSIRAPISGRTSNLLVHEGNLVRANDTQALVVINQITPIRVAFSIPERRLSEVLDLSRGGAKLDVRAAAPGYAGKPADGLLTFINNAVDPTTGTILLKAEFDNDDRILWPGEFVEVTVVLTTKMGAVVVPAAAVQSGQKGDYVLVVKADFTTEMRPVRTGMRADGKALIESGLEPGETVITDGHLRVVPGGKVVAKESLSGGAAAGTPGR